MALKFKLVMRKNLGEDHESIPEKVYAQMVYGDLVTFDEFAEEVADSSGVGSASAVSYTHLTLPTTSIV